MTTVWVLTYEVNDYNQRDEYYLATYANKPTIEQLIFHTKYEHIAEHVLGGGGRKDVEDQWFWLREEKLR